MIMTDVKCNYNTWNPCEISTRICTQKSQLYKVKLSPESTNKWCGSVVGGGGGGELQPKNLQKHATDYTVMHTHITTPTHVHVRARTHTHTHTHRAHIPSTLGKETHTLIRGWSKEKTEQYLPSQYILLQTGSITTVHLVVNWLDSHSTSCCKLAP